jgi:hypothetical protein
MVFHMLDVLRKAETICYISETYIEPRVLAPTGDFQKHLEGGISVIKIAALYKDPLHKELSCMCVSTI